MTCITEVRHSQLEAISKVKTTLVYKGFLVLFMLFTTHKATLCSKQKYMLCYRRRLTVIGRRMWSNRLSFLHGQSVTLKQSTQKIKHVLIESWLYTLCLTDLLIGALTFGHIWVLKTFQNMNDLVKEESLICCWYDV